MVGRAVYIKTIFAVLLAAGFWFGVAASPAQAITLIPPSLELGLTPGQPLKTMVKLFNESLSQVTLYTEARNFTAKGDTGQPNFDFVGTEQIGLSSWVQMEKGPIVLEAGQRYEVPVTITPPANADPGGHYAAIFFSTSPPEEGQVRVASKVGTLILASVEGLVAERGSIAEFTATGAKQWYSRLPVELSVHFRNEGNVHLKPGGTVTVKNIFGRTSATLEFNASKGATLRETTRRYGLLWERGAVDATSGNAWSDFWREYGNERRNFAIGKYTLTLNLVAGTDSSVQDTAALSVWVFPWHICLIWLVAAALAVWLVMFLVKRYNRWIITKAKT
ncbi:MAG: hypothetical protein V1916_00880 [Patescibacteria group bacterium]